MNKWSGLARGISEGIQNVGRIDEISDRRTRAGREETKAARDAADYAYENTPRMSMRELIKSQVPHLDTQAINELAEGPGRMFGDPDVKLSLKQLRPVGETVGKDPRFGEWISDAQLKSLGRAKIGDPANAAVYEEKIARINAGRETAKLKHQKTVAEIDKLTAEAEEKRADARYPKQAREDRRDARRETAADRRSAERIEADDARVRRAEEKQLGIDRRTFNAKLTDIINKAGGADQVPASTYDALNLEAERRGLEPIQYDKKGTWDFGGEVRNVRLPKAKAEKKDATNIPAGATKTDKTSGGKPVYKLPNGKYWVAD